MYSDGDVFFIRFVYIFLNVVNIFVFIFVGNRLQHCKTNKTYWKNAFWIILSYSILMGLRFGRLIDYNIYFERYQDIGKNFIDSEYEFTFKVLCWCFYKLGLSYKVFIFFTSVLVIYSFLYFIKKYRNKILPSLMLLLFLNEAYNAEQLIRWYVAFPFFLIAVTNYIDKKYLLALLLAILSCSIHKGLSILIGIVWAVSYIKKQIVPTWLAAILFALSVFLGRISIFDSISPYLTLISFEDEKTMIYLNRFSDFVTDNVTDREVLTYTILNKVRMYGAYIFAVFMLPLLLKKKIISVFETNVFLISLILFPMLCQADVLNRYGDGLKFISTIVSAAGYGYVITNRKQFPRWLYYMCFISIYFYMKPQFDRIFMRSEWWTMLYVWDANGQDCLPKSLFLK